MPVVTITGQYAAGVPEVARMVADCLGASYLDQEILKEAAERVGASPEVLAERDERLDTVGQRIAATIRRMLETQASVGMVGDMFMESSGTPLLLARSYEEAAQTPITRADELDDRRYIALIRSVIEDIANLHHVVIVGRGGQFILKDRPGALHVRLIAPMSARIERVLHQEGGEPRAIEKMLRDRDQVQAAYFRKYFKEDVRDAMHYDIVLNTAKIPFERCARIIADLAALVAQR